MSITKINVQNPGQFYQGASFHHEGQRYTANIGLGGRKSELYAYGAPGDGCITTYEIENDALLNEIESFVRMANDAATQS